MEVSILLLDIKLCPGMSLVIQCSMYNRLLLNDMQVFGEGLLQRCHPTERHRLQRKSQRATDPESTGLICLLSSPRAVSQVQLLLRPLLTVSAHPALVALVTTFATSDFVFVPTVYLGGRQCGRDDPLS